MRKEIKNLLIILLILATYCFPLDIYATVPEEDNEQSVISPASTEDEEQQQTETQDQVESSQLEIQVHERYRTENSSTTDLDQMDQVQLSHVEQLTYEEANKNMVMFKDELDLSSENAIEKMSKFHEYADFSVKGKVTIDTDYLDMLDVPATVTMYDLPFGTTPMIYKDGVRATADEVSNVVYIFSNSEGVGTLTFDVTSFSTYEARGDETVGQVYPTTNPIFQMLLLIGLITLIGIVVVVGVKLVEKKREKKPSNNQGISNQNTPVEGEVNG